MTGKLIDATTAASEWAAGRGVKWGAQLSRMEATLLPIDEPLIRALQLERPFRIADAGCGGGGTAWEILRRAPAGTTVHGFDISPTLIELARRRARPEQRAVVFDVADMAKAAPDEPYERLVSRLGIMFFDDPQAAFANLVRWLEPGGRFAFAVWGTPSENPWMTSVRDVVASIVDVPKSDPDAPGLFRYANADKLLGVLDDVGLGDLNVQDWRGALALGGGLPAAEAAEFALASFASFGELLTKAGEDAFEQARRSLTACYADHDRDGVVQMGACVRIVTGARR